ELRDAARVAPAVEGRRQPDVDDLHHQLPRHQALAERDDVGVVVAARQLGALAAPAERAAHAAHAVGGHRLAVARAAEDDAALALPRRHRLRRGADEQRIVDRFLGMRTEVDRLVPALGQQGAQLLLVTKPGVIRGDSDPHGAYASARTNRRTPAMTPTRTFAVAVVAVTVAATARGAVLTGGAAGSHRAIQA